MFRIISLSTVAAMWILCNYFFVKNYLMKPNNKFQVKLKYARKDRMTIAVEKAWLTRNWHERTFSGNFAVSKLRE